MKILRLISSSALVILCICKKPVRALDALTEGFTVRHTYTNVLNGIETTLYKHGSLVGCVWYKKQLLQGRQEYIQWLSHLKIEPQFRNQGLGSLLLRHVLAQCTGDCLTTQLIAIPEGGCSSNRERLFSFYEKHGGIANDSSAQCATFEFEPVNNLLKPDNHT